jgi:hypothetical protein
LTETLKSLLRRRLDETDILPILQEMREGADRSAALIGCTLVEMALYELLLSKCVGLTSTEDNQLFGTTAPLSGFSARTRTAYAFGFIGPNTRQHLDRLREIRNVFAHSPAIISFETPAIAIATANLEIATAAPTSRERYMLAVKALNMHIWAKAADGRSLARPVIGLD